MTTQHDGRSRESKYYHARRARGDYLFRLWADAETQRKFKMICGQNLREDVFHDMVALCHKSWVLGDAP